MKFEHPSPRLVYTAIMSFDILLMLLLILATLTIFVL
jgi:hypothetical protein